MRYLYSLFSLITLCLDFTITAGFQNQLNCHNNIMQSTIAPNRFTCLAFSKGDKIREKNGVRPSLHPTTINALAEALKARAMNKEGMAFRVSDTVQPLDIAITAGQIASTAISKRQQSSTEDGMQLTAKEEQTIAGRVLGVIMRLDELEDTLFEKVSKVGWVTKYNEWATFGVLKTANEGVNERIKDDPLFSMSRAECLLAIFLQTVEIPGLEKAKETVPDGSKIDFLDQDRYEVLLGSDD